MFKQIPHKIINNEELKLCSTCKEWLPLNRYHKDKGRIDGFNHHCKSCSRSKHLKYFSDEANRERRRKTASAWTDRHRDRLNKQRNERRKNDKGHRNKVNRVWVNKNRDRVRESNRKYDAKRYATDKGRISALIATGMRHCLKDGKNERHWETLVDYDYLQLKKHLIKTLPSGYSWDDFMGGLLHIDHIVPKRAFNFNKPEDIDFKRCWSLKNLRLLPALENMSKQGKLEKPFQPSLALAI